MKSKLRIYGIYLPVLFIIGCAAIVLGTISEINYLEPSGHLSNSLLSTVAGYLVLAAAVFFLSYIIIARGGARLIPSFTSPLNYGPCAIMGAALLFIAVHLFTKTDLTAGLGGIYAPIVGALALAAISYFVISALSIKRTSLRRADLGLLVLIFMCAYVTYIFFDTETALNAPIKINYQVAFLSTMVFFLYETRLSLGREKWRAYVAFGFIASLTTAYAAIPSLISYLVSGKCGALSIYEMILTLAMFIFSFSKIMLVSELIEERSSKTVEELIKYAEAREAELTPKKDELTEAEATDENQLSIEDIEPETEIIDAPDVEESFLLEQELPTLDEPTYHTQGDATPNAEDDFAPYSETDEFGTMSATEEKDETVR